MLGRCAIKMMKTLVEQILEHTCQKSLMHQTCAVVRYFNVMKTRCLLVYSPQLNVSIVSFEAPLGKIEPSVVTL